MSCEFVVGLAAGNEVGRRVFIGWDEEPTAATSGSSGVEQLGLRLGERLFNGPGCSSFSCLRQALFTFIRQD